VLRFLEQDLKNGVYQKQILLSFIGDVYCDNTDNSRTTRGALQLLNRYNAPVAVLSKGGNKMLRDIDVFKGFNGRIAVGSTLTFFDEDKSREWESGAALPAGRLEALKQIHQSGVRTFASFEPVVEPAESLKLIEQTLRDDSVDYYKIGKLNNYKGLAQNMDWGRFLSSALSLLRPARKQVYIKRDLRDAALGVELFDEEIDPERYIIR
jgi:DNA repair photolyase